MLNRRILAYAGLALIVAGCAEQRRPLETHIPPPPPAPSAYSTAPVRPVARPPEPAASAPARPSASAPARVVSAHRQYYDQRRKRYYYFDPARRAYFWEDGTPK